MDDEPAFAQEHNFEKGRAGRHGSSECFALLKTAARKKVSDFVKGTAKERCGALGVRNEVCVQIFVWPPGVKTSIRWRGF